MIRSILIAAILGSIVGCATVSSHMSKGIAFKQNHSGFMLYDPVSNKILDDFQSEKYFTPASNTKIFSFFAGLSVLGDSVPAIRYYETGDSLIIWGTGDPSFLNPNLMQGKTWRFLSQSEKVIYYSSANFHDSHFGPGWAWDDYNDWYSLEKTALPIYGNYVHLEKPVDSEVLTSQPAFFSTFLSPDFSASSSPTIWRGLGDNIINFKDLEFGKRVVKDLPIHFDEELIRLLLEDTLKRDIGLINLAIPSDASTYYSIPVDSIYKRMMQASDNFIAEQIMLMVAQTVSDSLNTRIGIDYVTKEFLGDLPDKPIWRDGSGLTRYNLFTPRSIVRLWEKIYDKVPEERLFQLLATGGVAGTIENWYADDQPYIFGKTGTLANNHSLSGFIKTKKGRTLIFSFMHNNYVTGSVTFKREMQQMLESIRDKY